MLALTVPLLMSGCAAGPATETPEPQIVTRTRIIDTACQWVRAILPSKADVLTDGTAKQIATHNELGEQKCGWKPNAK